MATFNIEATTTVADLKKQFRDAVGGTLRVYDGGSQADTDKTLMSLGATTGTFECRTSLTVGSFEKSMLKNHNLKVKVYPADDWVKVLDGITLSKVADIPKQTTRKDMLPLLSYKRGHASELPGIVEADIREWLKETALSGKAPFHNELDLQVNLAIYLHKTGNYDEVQTEYFIDKNALPTKENVWGKNMNLDIVLRRGDEWLVIEIKYKTRAIKEDLERFSERVNFNSSKTQGASNFGMYGFWKDVRRIEIIKHRFGGVAGGIALFVTNDPYYLTGPKSDVACSNFSTSDGTHGPDMSWKKGSTNDKKTGEHANFTLDREYEVKWESCEATDETRKFHYVIMKV